METWRQRHLGCGGFPADLTEPELAFFFTFTPEQAEAIGSRREEVHRLGLALHLAFLQLSGESLDLGHIVSPAVLECTARVAAVPAPRIASLRSIYGRQRRLLFAHRRVAMEALAVKDFTQTTERALTGYLRRAAITAPDRSDLIRRARAWLYDHRYVAPGRRRLEDLAAAAQAFVLTSLRTTMRRQVGAARLDAWCRELASAGGLAGMSLLDWLRRPVGGFGTRDLEDVQARLLELQRLGAEQLDPPELPLERLRVLARAVALRKPSTLGRVREPRRTVEIGCWLRLQLLTLTDTLLEQMSRRVGELWSRARFAVEARAAQELVRYRSGMDAICTALRDPSLDPATFRTLVAAAAGPFLRQPPSCSKARAIREEMAREPARLRTMPRQVVGLRLSIRDGHALVPVLHALREGYDSGSDPAMAETISGLPPAALRGAPGPALGDAGRGRDGR